MLISWQRLVQWRWQPLRGGGSPIALFPKRCAKGRFARNQYSRELNNLDFDAGDRVTTGCIRIWRVWSIHARAKIKIIPQAVKAPALRLMQCGKESVGLVDPEKPGANPALMYHTVKVILQSEKIDGVAA